MKWLKILTVAALIFGLSHVVSAAKADYRVEVKAYDAVHIKSVYIGMALNDGPVHWYDDAESEFNSLDISVVPFSVTFNCMLYPSVFVLVESFHDGEYDPDLKVTVVMELYKNDALIRSRQVTITRPDDMSYGLDEGEDHD